MLDLEMEEKQAHLDMSEALEKENMAVFYRIKAQLNRVEREKEGEANLAICINEKLEIAE